MGFCTNQCLTLTMKNSGDGSTDWGFLVCNQDQTAADAGYKRQTHPLPSIGHHAIWRMNMIQLKNRPFAGKAPTTTQQAEFSIGWRFCPVCGNKLYQKIEGCSGILQVKCNRCKETLRLDLAFRCRWFSSHFNKYGCIAPWIWTVRSEQRAIAARQCMKRAPNSRATADRVILL